ncbi:thiamine pyrophosphate-binding protein [Propylenella binzhouense]|uniref:Thiamine pyrophosphate-binding protein n=1 Tax=Propylenella binzhouense TaxID=2555902 RepID=A0A964T271_9HYPH|nr:thiamine pyrophosphate-binding protein [Propylenella binzhouense]
MSEYTVSDLVAEVLAACGVRTAFGISSVHNIPLLDALGRRNAIRFISSRGEMGGGHMADGYARVSGELGVLITSTGPGAANAVPALVEARFAGSRLLHITSRSATRLLGRDTGSVHDVPGQSEMLAAVGKACLQVHRAEETFGVLLAAICEALSAPTGPATVEIPVDLQRLPVARPANLDDLTIPLRPPQAPSPTDLAAIEALVRESRRPMLWLGNGAKGATDGALRLANLGFGIVTSWNGRAIVPDDHPATLGALHGSGSPRIEAFYDTVDLMLVVGSRLRGHETMDGTLSLPRRRVQIDVDPRAAGRTYGCDLFVRGDAGLVLEALADRLVAAGYAADPRLHADLAEARAEAADAYRQTLGPYHDFARQLRKALPSDCVFARDATVAASTWGHRLVPLYNPRDSVHSVGAAIGLGLPLGIGAAIAAGEQGRKAVALVGDGGFALSMNELWTAVQQNVDLTVIVMNDGMYAAIGHMQDALVDGRRRYLDVLSPDLSRLADAAGIPCIRVDRAELFEEAVSRAVAVAGPVLVDVDMRAIGAAPAYWSWSPPNSEKSSAPPR